MVLCCDDTIYTGITNDIANRILSHNKGKGAKYTKTRLPVKLIYQSSFPNRSEASKEEYRIKQLPRKDKLNMIDKAKEDMIQKLLSTKEGREKLASYMTIPIRCGGTTYIDNVLYYRIEGYLIPFNIVQLGWKAIKEYQTTQTPFNELYMSGLKGGLTR